MITLLSRPSRSSTIRISVDSASQSPTAGRAPSTTDLLRATATAADLPAEMDPRAVVTSHASTARSLVTSHVSAPSLDSRETEDPDLAASTATEEAAEASEVASVVTEAASVEATAEDSEVEETLADVTTEGAVLVSAGPLPAVTAGHPLATATIDVEAAAAAEEETEDVVRGLSQAT